MQDGGNSHPENACGNAVAVKRFSISNPGERQLAFTALFIESIMDELMICELRKMLSRGVRVAWAMEDAFHEIREVVFVSDEERAIFADGSGRYVDLFNVSPNCIVSFQNVFSIR
jgi:hypothetical protein